MSNDIQDKLSIIMAAYAKNLPSKTEALKEICEGLMHQWNQDQFMEFYRQVHSLHGSAGMYGFKDLGQIAEKIENYLKPFINQKPTAKEWRHAQQLLEVLSKHSHDIVQIHPKIAPVGTQPHNYSKTIYLLEKDSSLTQTIGLQLGSFGYVTKIFQDPGIFARNLDQSTNILAAIIDIKFLDKEFEAIIEKLSFKKQSTPLFFVAENDDFELHLMAVRAGGQGYFTTPIQIEDIVARLEELANDKDPYNILIVEDDADTANFYQAILQQAGMKTQVVTQPSQIDKALSDYSPDLILMDIHMPGCNGLELATIIRQRNIYASIPIVFLSSEKNKRIQLAAMSLGGDDFIDKSVKPEHLIYMVKNRAARYDELRSLMLKDGLTGALNHSAIHQKLESDLRLAHRLNIPLAAVMIDLDHFKKVNDRYGHRVGDQVLKNLCVLMQTRLRKTDTVGRYGGEEFLIILPNTSEEAAKKLINEIREQFSKILFFSREKKFQVTFSAGIATSPPYMTLESIVLAADQTMYRAKNLGRNQVSTDEKSNVPVVTDA